MTKMKIKNEKNMMKTSKKACKDDYYITDSTTLHDVKTPHNDDYYILPLITLCIRCNPLKSYQ